MDTGDIMSLLDAEQPPDYQQVILLAQFSESDSNSYLDKKIGSVSEKMEIYYTFYKENI